MYNAVVGDILVGVIILFICCSLAYNRGKEKGNEGKPKTEIKYIDRIVSAKIELPNGGKIWVG